jgi:hypothetical protein
LTRRAATELLDERRIDDRPSLDDPLERFDEFVHVRHAALQQVATALAAGEQVRRLLDLDVRGENEDRDLREFFADRARGIEPFARVAGWHPDVDDRELRLMLPNESHQLGSGPGLAHDIEAGALEQTRHTLAEQDVVVREHHSRPVLRHTADYGVPAQPGRCLVDSR